MRYIYLLKDPISNEVKYVGESVDPVRRYWNHLSDKHTKNIEKDKWINSLFTLGLKPVLEIIDTANTKMEALLKENREIVSRLKRGDLLVNIKSTKTLKQYTLDGILVAEYCSQSIAKKIFGFKPKPYRNTSKGFVWSYDEFNKTQAFNENGSRKITKKAVLQIKDGVTIKEFEGAREAGRDTGICSQSISKVAAGSKARKHAGGYEWKYKFN